MIAISFLIGKNNIYNLSNTKYNNTDDDYPKENIFFFRAMGSDADNFLTFYFYFTVDNVKPLIEAKNLYLKM
jgi:hypothetical protein